MQPVIRQWYRGPLLEVTSQCSNLFHRVSEPLGGNSNRFLSYLSLCIITFFSLCNIVSAYCSFCIREIVPFAEIFTCFKRGQLHKRTSLRSRMFSPHRRAFRDFLIGLKICQTRKLFREISFFLFSFFFFFLLSETGLHSRAKIAITRFTNVEFGKWIEKVDFGAFLVTFRFQACQVVETQVFWKLSHS